LIYKWAIVGLKFKRGFMIDKLTPEQEAKLPEYRDKWISIGLSTEPADRPRAEAAVKELYKLVGFPEPEIQWRDDPLQGSRAAGEYVENYFKDKPKPQNYDDLVRSARRSWIGGSLWAGYAAWADFFNREVGIEINRAYLELVESVGYYFCLRGLVVLTERPSKILRDERGRLHNPTGKAIEYPSGWGIYAIHGVRVDEDIILHPEQITAERVLKEPNVEIRRVMLDILGRPAFMAQLSAAGLVEVLDQDMDSLGFPRRLIRIQLPDDETIVAVDVLNSTLEPDGTRKPYFIFPEPTLKPALVLADGTSRLIDGAQAQELTCHNAVASTFGYYGHEYGKNGQFRQGDVLVVFKDGENLNVNFQES
jgi:hypothetical protein